MESNALRQRASWLRSVASKLPSREVAETLDHYADEMLDEAHRLERINAWPLPSRMTH
jgi:hypothetical protein